MLYYYFTYNQLDTDEDELLNNLRVASEQYSIPLKNIYYERYNHHTKFLKMIKLFKPKDILYVNELCDIAKDSTLLYNTLKTLLDNDIQVNIITPAITINQSHILLLEYLNNNKQIILDYQLSMNSTNTKNKSNDANKPIFTSTKQNVTQKWIQIYKLWKTKTIRTCDAAKLLNISKPTFLRYVKNFESVKDIIPTSAVDDTLKEKTLCNDELSQELQRINTKVNTDELDNFNDIKDIDFSEELI